MRKFLTTAQSLRICTALFLITFALDRLTKYAALTNLALRDVPVCKGINLSLSYNYGLSWSLFSTKTTLGKQLLLAAVCSVLLGLIVYAWRQYHRGITLVPESLILAGAVSNIVDRIWYGGVIDFLDFYCGTWHWPTFNLADCAIVFGVGLLIARMLYDDQT